MADQNNHTHISSVETLNKKLAIHGTVCEGIIYYLGDLDVDNMATALRESLAELRVAIESIDGVTLEV